MQLKNPNSEKLKIGLVFDDSLDRPDGVSQYVKTLGKWLSAQGHEVRYLVGQTTLEQWQGGRVYSLSKNIPVSFNGNRLTTPLPVKKSRVREILSFEEFDVLHIQIPYSPFMAKTVINNSAALTAVVGTFHILPAGWMASWGTKLLRLTYGRSLKRVDKMLSVSTSAAEFAQQTLKRESSVLPNVVESAVFGKTKKIARSGSHIIFLGRLVERKGCLFLLKAFLIIAAKYPNARLTIAGDGPDRNELEDFVKKNNLQKQVSFLGFIDENDKPNLLGSTDIACFPSLYGESFGIVLIEAMAAGAGVVIGGNNPGYKTVLEPEALFDPKNPNQLALLLENLMNNKELSARIHLKQQQDVKKYDIEIVGAKLVEIYRSAVAKKRLKSHNKF
ncbi:glycosyltransferase family 4 protein [Candidatus Saccharibacteria bacterium]|nr:glycosyltransferase family 4 protein [Candidatus Saccharibacteria bacterium]